MKTISKLGIGPMSPEIIESVFCHSQKNKQPLMLIASKNQIDWDGGYVGAWTTAQYCNFIKSLKNKYREAEVYICRDHLGPGFKNDDLADVYKTIDSDIENGFDLIHVDFCHYKGARQQLLDESKKAIEYIHKQKPGMLIEVGTDENTGAFLEDLDRIEKEMQFFSNFVKMQFFVVQSGSLVKENYQAGGFNKEFLQKVRPLAEKYQVGIKEHNCDYIEAENLRLRKGLVNAVNVAPQFGVIQTMLTLQKCSTYGIDANDFLHEAYQSGRWQKWLHKSNAENKFLCSVIAGHYIFAGEAYKRLYEKISRQENFRQSIMDEMMKNFALYLSNI